MTRVVLPATKPQASSTITPSDDGVAGSCLSCNPRAGVGARAALYADKKSLMACARQAERAGLRVVTMVNARAGAVGGLWGCKLTTLVDRLGEGEFDVIVADAGAGRVVTIAANEREENAGVGNRAVTPATSVDLGGLRGQGDHREVPRRRAVRCAIYMRCASPSRAMPYPQADQREACEAYAAKKGWETLMVYKAVEGKGRKRFSGSFASMMADAKSGLFDVLLVKDLDRLSRNTSKLHAFVEAMENLGVVVHSVSSGPTTSREPSVGYFTPLHSAAEAEAFISLIRKRRALGERAGRGCHG